MIIVDGYNIPVSVLKHKKNTTVIQMWHALAAIKKFGYQSIGYKDGVNKTIAKILKMQRFIIRKLFWCKSGCYKHILAPVQELFANCY